MALPLNPAKGRLLREFEALRKASEQNGTGTTVDLEDEKNLLNWLITIRGPNGTAFEGGKFKIALSFPETYPEKPPGIKFITRVFHPNVFEHDGSVCLDILGHNWRPRCDVALIIGALGDFLDNPNPRSPANHNATRLYMQDIDAYKDRVRRLIQANSQNDEESAKRILCENSSPRDYADVPEAFVLTPELVARVRLGQDFESLRPKLDGLSEIFKNVELNTREISLNGHLIVPLYGTHDVQQLNFVVKFSAEYPHGSTGVLFPGRPFHPNISDDGRCNDQQLFGNWMTFGRQDRLVSLLQAIRSLFIQPNPNFIANAKAAVAFGLRAPKDLPDSVKLLLYQEIENLNNAGPPGISVGPTSQDDVCRAIIVGPDGSPYEGNIYDLAIEIPTHFPNEMPEVRFISEICHQSVDSEGHIPSMRNFWTPGMNIGNLLISIQQLLSRLPTGNGSSSSSSDNTKCSIND